MESQVFLKQLWAEIFCLEEQVFLQEFFCLLVFNNLGIVTRRPLILQLLNKKASATGPKEWGEFLHIPGQKFDFNGLHYSLFFLIHAFD